MHGGFRRLIHPGTPANEIDVEGTKKQRARINQAIRQHEEQVKLQARDYPELRVPKSEEP
jgi:hypothetical protein